MTNETTAQLEDKDGNTFEIPVTYSYEEMTPDFDMGRGILTQNFFVDNYDTTQEAWDMLCATGEHRFYDEVVREAIREQLGGSVEFPAVRHKATIVETQNPN